MVPDTSPLVIFLPMCYNSRATKLYLIMQLLEGECIKPLTEFPDYSVTNQGRIYSHISDKFLKPSVDRYYHKVRLKRGDKYICRHVHILVGRAYLPDYKEGLNILHIDETLPYPQRHSAANLRVGSQADNIKEMYDKGRRVSNFAEYDVRWRVDNHIRHSK